MSNHDYTSIQQDFIKGYEEIYSELYSDQVSLSLFDKENTKIDTLYGETDKKAYLTPITLLGHVDVDVNSENEKNETYDITSIVSFPVKAFLDNNISFNTVEDLKTLRKSLISYGGFTFKVDRVEPTSFIGDMFHIYKFYCRQID